MAKTRYVKTPEELRTAAKFNPEFLPSSMCQVRALYESDPEVIAALLPPPLEPTASAHVGVTISQVSMHLGPGLDIEIGAGVFGVAASYKGVEGLYMVTMPMTTEGAVVGGRETYGEPKKLAEIEFRKDGDRVSATVTRHGITYLEVAGQVRGSLGPRQLTQHAYCFKCLPALDRSKGLEFDPLLVRLEWQNRLDKVERMDGEVILRESPMDPVIDLPVRRIVAMTYEEGTSRSGGTVLCSVPAAGLLPYLHQRYDDITPLLAAMAEPDVAVAGGTHA